jgi:hypothetical protein
MRRITKGPGSAFRFTPEYIAAMGGPIEGKDSTMDWLTNIPEAATALTAADNAWRTARKAAEHLPLTEKVEAYRAAKTARDFAYLAVHAKYGA